MSLAKANAGDRVLYHIGPRPPTPNYHTGWGTPLEKGWERPWLPKRVLSGVFLTPDPLPVSQFHGKRGNVYAVLVPEFVIRAAHGLHRYDAATEILVPRHLWSHVKLLGKVMDRKTLLQATRHKFTGPVLLEGVSGETKSSKFWPGMKADLWKEEKEDRRLERLDKARGKKGWVAKLRREERERAKRFEQARKSKSNPLLRPDERVSASVLGGAQPRVILYKTVHGEAHRLGSITLEPEESLQPEKDGGVTGNWYPIYVTAGKGWGPLLYDVAATALQIIIVPSDYRSPHAERFWSRQTKIPVYPKGSPPRYGIAPLTDKQFRDKYGVSLTDLLRPPVRKNTVLVPPTKVIEGPLSTQVLRVPNSNMWVGLVKDRYLTPVAMFGPTDDVDELFPHLDEYVDVHETGSW